jgi:hypothetical protein
MPTELLGFREPPQRFRRPNRFHCNVNLLSQVGAHRSAERWTADCQRPASYREDQQEERSVNIQQVGSGLFPHTMPIALGGGHRAPYWIFPLQGHCPEHETKRSKTRTEQRCPAESSNRGNKSLSAGIGRLDHEGARGYLADLRNVAGFQYN